MSQEKLLTAFTKTYHKTIVCFNCCGIGTVLITEFKGHSRGYENREETCLVCNGAKVIERVTTINYYKQ